MFRFIVEENTITAQFEVFICWFLSSVILCLHLCRVCRHSVFILNLFFHCQFSVHFGLVVLT